MNNSNILFSEIQKSAKKLAQISSEQISEVLETLAKLTLSNINSIIKANRQDLEKMDPKDPKYDRLMLTKERIEAIASEIRQIKGLNSPIGDILEEKTLENGLLLKKVSVPIGVIGVIYEARPNVTFDVFCIALKSRNGLVLKGSSDAEFSNKEIMKIIQEALKVHDIPMEAFILLPPDRSATDELLNAVGYVDIIIPRGSQQLIDFVRKNSKVPVIETGAGIVHTYFDESADLDSGKSIILNSKTRRPSVCNSLDCLIIHESRLSDLNKIVEDLLDKNVEIFADEKSFEILDQHELINLANESHFGTEFLSLKMSIKTVSNLDEAIEHIDRYSSKHSEAILSNSEENIALFLNTVDAAAVYVNASTAFTDGNQFGMGAEIGISTQKLHARGPMALKELTSYKWIVIGNGQIRS
ncbi:glutamate-5-semialdehyde dehydrogenase [Belliella sp. DSM 107340]|uniref:Gamma-glutamyl phosphate reductase n=1 Tax=Belliella calami TaxID=2923436 RepID=A0ABS9UJ32_9BACT|nr:glutamate-5-semialdehyde dehydrogenase [Belliella calami]MCH7396369.1 glutamate-5-semialdehyde dehydrogenase [Belliella calami]